MKIFKLIIKWIFCLLFMLTGVFFGEFVDSLLMLEDLFISSFFKLSIIGFIVCGLIISPWFEIFSKKINRKYSGLRKFILIFGTILISIMCSLVFSKLYNNSSLGYIWSIILTLLFILLYFYIIYLTNNHKYEDGVKNKWYIVLLVVIVLLSIPYFMIKGLIVNSYNNMMEHFDIQFLDTVKIESVELEEKDYYVFEYLKIKYDFKEYEIVNEQEEPYKSITFVDKDNLKLKGIFFNNYDMFRDNYNDVVKLTENNVLYKFHPYAKFILSNNISSEQNYYKYLSKNQKLSIFDSIGKIYISWIFANISLSSITSFEFVENNDYDISIMTSHSSDKGNIKMIEIIDEDKVYMITLFITKDFSDNELYSFISSIKIN